MGKPREIVAPRELHIPESDKMKVVMAGLTDAGRADFLAELYEALDHAQASNDLVSVQFVVDSWWVSRMFAQHPRFDAALEAAEASITTDRHYTPDEVQELLALT